MKCYENAIQTRKQKLSIRLALLACNTLELVHIGRADGGPDYRQMVDLGHVVPAVIVLNKGYPDLADYTTLCDFDLFSRVIPPISSPLWWDSNPDGTYFYDTR